MMSGLLKQPADIAALKEDLRLSDFLTTPFTVDILLSSILSSLGAAPADAPPPQAPPQPPADQQVRALKGSLEKMPFERVLFYLLQHKRTGVLTLTRDSVNRTYFLIDGAVTDLDYRARGQRLRRLPGREEAGRGSGTP